MPDKREKPRVTCQSSSGETTIFIWFDAKPSDNSTVSGVLSVILDIRLGTQN